MLSFILGLSSIQAKLIKVTAKITPIPNTFMKELIENLLLSFWEEEK
jgi:hypothetical protein